MELTDYILIIVILIITIYYFYPTTKIVPRKIAQKPKKKSILPFVTLNSNSVVLYYASQTGTAQDLATRFSKEVGALLGVPTLVCDIEDYDMTHIERLGDDEGDVVERKSCSVFMMATYGEGEPTDNSESFYEYVMGGMSYGRVECDGSDSPIEFTLNHLVFMTFGLGNRTYTYFNAISERLRTRLMKLGARCLADGVGDDNKSMEDDFFKWKQGALERLSEFFEVEIVKVDVDAMHVPAYSHCFVEEEGGSGVISNGSGKLDSKNPVYCPLVKRETLFCDAVERIGAVVLERQCFHLEIDTSVTGLAYQTGDHVGVYPTNHESQVERFLKLIGEFENRNRVCEFSGDVGFPKCSLGVMVKHYLDILAPVKQDTFLVLGKYSNDSRVKELFKSRDLYQKDVETMNMNIMDCIERFSIKITLDVAVEILTRIQLRYYSISSSNVCEPGLVSISAVWVHYPTLTETPIIRKGLATDYLKEAEIGTMVPVTLRKSHFRLAKPDVPIIMIGPGGFIHERQELSKHTVIAKTILFYGCRDSNEYMYRNELSALNNPEIQIHCAYSRKPGTTKKYVQDMLKEQQKQVGDLIEMGGVVYVCGDGSRMAQDVWRVFGEMFGGDVMDRLKKDLRYLEDVWS